MSLNLLNSYESDFETKLEELNKCLQDQPKLNEYFKKGNDPKEYKNVSNCLKQMEIESMNFMDSDEYARNRKEGDAVRKRVQIHKKSFDVARKEMR